MARDTNSRSFALLSAIRPYAVALGYPVTAASLLIRLDHSGARRVEAPHATFDDPAYLVASLREPLRQAVESAGPEMLAFLRLQACSPRGIERANRHQKTVAGRPDLVFITAEALRVTPEDLMTVLLNGDAIPTRLSEEIATIFRVDLDWLLCRDLLKERESASKLH